MLSPMPLLAPVITTTLSVIFDIPILFFSFIEEICFSRRFSFQAGASCGYLKNQFQFDRHAERKAGYAVHQSARVFVFSENVLQQL